MTKVTEVQNTKVE